MRRVMLALLLIAGILCDSSADACTTIIVGKGATVDGSIIIARNEDTSVFWKNRKLQALVMQDYPRFAPMVIAAIVDLEKNIARMQERMEKDYLKIYTKDAVSAKRRIASFNRAALSKQDKMISRLTRKIASSLGMENLTDEQFTEMIRKVEAAYHFHGA
jgi:dipeptidase